MKTDWNIEGIADKVIKAMKDDNAGIDSVDDYIHDICYLPIRGRMPKDAKIVSEQVKELVINKYEEI